MFGYSLGSAKYEQQKQKIRNNLEKYSQSKKITKQLTEQLKKLYKNDQEFIRDNKILKSGEHIIEIDGETCKVNIQDRVKLTQNQLEEMIKDTLECGKRQYPKTFANRFTKTTSYTVWADSMGNLHVRCYVGLRSYVEVYAFV